MSKRSLITAYVLVPVAVGSGGGFLLALEGTADGQSAAAGVMFALATSCVLLAALFAAAARLAKGLNRLVLGSVALSRGLLGAGIAALPFSWQIGVGLALTGFVAALVGRQLARRSRLASSPNGS